MDYLNLDFSTIMISLLVIVVIILISLWIFYLLRRFLLRMGYATPLICVILLLLIFFTPFTKEDFMRTYRYFFNDNKAYYSCVGNRDHEAGIKDCTDLIAKLETPEGITLEGIPDTKGEYWLSEAVSYRGRHLIRMGKLEEGKSDFKRALLMDEGIAVTVHNLAETGHIRSEIFQKDYDDSVDALQAAAFCQVAGVILDEDVTSIIKQQEVLSVEAAKLCRVSTGGDTDECKQQMDGRIKDTRFRAGRIYQRANPETVRMEYDNCKP